MKQLGAECLGIEPGRQGQNAYEKYGVQVIQDFFPSNQISGTFDIIIFYGVLEHIENPFDFLTELNKVLEPNSKLLLSVPNCEPHIEKGIFQYCFMNTGITLLASPFIIRLFL